MREYFTDLDGPQKMLLGVIAAGSIGIGALAYNDIQNNGGDVLPAPVQESSYETCDSVRIAYMTVSDEDREDLQRKIDELCQ